MKNYFEKICDFKNLHSAYLKARKGKRYRRKILEFGQKLEENLLRLKSDLESESYQHGQYRQFIVCDSKKRQIKAAPFRDRVVHHAVCNIIEPIFEKGFISDSYACQRKKGTHKAVKRLQSFIKSAREQKKRERGGGLKSSVKIYPIRYSKLSNGAYCLKCDISKYFDSVNHEILLKLIGKKINCGKTMNLMEKIVRSDNAQAGKGIPIGNLTSQLFANIYLNELDNFLKRELQARYYIRYMDDFLILDWDKKKLREMKEKIKKFVENKLSLKLHPKKATVSPVDKGIDFLGYVVFENYKLLRKSTVKRFVKRTKKYAKMVEQKKMSEKKFDASVASWTAYADFGDSWRLRRKIGRIECEIGLSLV